MSRATAVIAALCLLSAAPAAAQQRPAREELGLLLWNNACSIAVQHFRYPATGEGLEKDPSWGRVGAVTLAPESARPTARWTLETGGNLVWDPNRAPSARAQLATEGYDRKGFEETIRPDRVAPRPDLQPLIHSTASFGVTYAAEWPPPPYALAKAYYSPLGTCVFAVFERPGPPPDVLRWQLARVPHEARRRRAQAHLDNAILLYRNESDIYGALEEAAIAARMDPRLAEARFHHSALLAAHGRFDEAIQELKEAVALDRRWAKLAREAQEFEDLRKDGRFKPVVRD